MLLISVNGDKNDEEDRYLNGYSTLHIKKQSPVSNKHSLKLLSLNNLHHIFIAQLVVQTHALRLVLHRRPTPTHTGTAAQCPCADGCRSLAPWGSPHAESPAPRNRESDPTHEFSKILQPLALYKYG